VCVYKRTTKKPKHNFSKHTQQAAAAAAAATIRQNTKNLHFEQLTPCSTASSNPITVLSHTRRRKVERKDASTSFLLVYFCGGREKLKLEIQKPLGRNFFFKRQPQKLDITKAAEETSKQTGDIGWVWNRREFFFWKLSVVAA
jgi:hypothetical protein